MPPLPFGFGQPDPNAPMVSLPMAPPDMGAPAMANVARIPTPVETNLAHDQAKLQKVQWAQDHPWGTPENHPGALGKLAHAFSVVGNIAGNIVAPGTMALIPHTQMGMKAQEEDLNNRVGGEEKQKTAEEEATSREGLQGAQQGEAEERTAEMPTAEKQAQEKIDQDQWKAIPGVIGPNGEPVEIEGKSGNIRFGNVQGMTPAKQPRPDTPEQQFIDEYRTKSHPGASIEDAERAYNMLPKFQQPPQAIMLVPGPNGGYQAQDVRPGSQVAPGAVSPGGLSSENVPDASTRSMVANAPGVLALANRVNQLVDQQVQSLGPAAGRWNDFWTGKVGAPNPQFKQLLTDTKLLKTKLMRMHVGARGGEYIMKSFDDMLNAGGDSPENLKAALGEITNYATELQQEAKNGQLAPGTQNPGEGVGGQPIVQHSASTGQYRYSTDGGKTWQAGKPKGQ